MVDFVMTCEFGQCEKCPVKVVTAILALGVIKRVCG
jgi:hypothetical protein